MCGAYIGMDEYRSRLAVLQEKFANDLVADMVPGPGERSVWSHVL
jgi:trimethyllysine dioxygenase